MRRALIATLLVLAALAAAAGVLIGRHHHGTRYACGETVAVTATTVWAAGADWTIGTGDHRMLFEAGGIIHDAGTPAATCANSFIGRPMVSTDATHEYVWWIDAPDGNPGTPAPSAGDRMVLGSFAGTAGVGRRVIPGGYIFVATLPVADCGAPNPAVLLTNANVTNAWNLPACR